MSTQPIDPKRTGVKAREVASYDDLAGGRNEEGFRLGIPGDMIRNKTPDGSLYGFSFACPGCGELCGVKVLSGKGDWTVVGGTLDDVTTLSLVPSIKVSCCGWHGYLRGGVFE